MVSPLGKPHHAEAHESRHGLESVLEWLRSPWGVDPGALRNLNVPKFCDTQNLCND